MKIIACDYHPSFQQIAMLDQNTGELSGRRLAHPAEAEAFYRGLQGPVRVGMEAIGNALWFERLLAELGHELWIGDAARIRAAAVRPQKTDARDAAHLLQLMLQDRFPRIWVPSPAERDLRQLLLHRHKLVQMRTQVKNQLQHLALNPGVRRRHGLWSRAGRQVLEQLALPPWTTRRRQDLLELWKALEQSLTELDRAVEAQALARPAARRLMSQPGVGPVVALAVVLTLGPVERFRHGKQVASYFGLIPREHSSGGRQRLGAISKQGNPFVRALLVQAAHVAVQHDAELRRQYQRLAQRKNRAVATVAIARKLAVRLYWILRRGAQASPETGSMQGSPSHSLAEGPGPMR
jgi:transposase